MRSRVVYLIPMPGKTRAGARMVKGMKEQRLLDAVHSGGTPKPIADLSKIDWREIELTDQQRAAADFYVNSPHLGMVAAFRAAGYSEGSATSYAHSFSKNPKFAAYIAGQMQEREDRTQVTQARVLHELSILGFSSVYDYKVDESGNLVLADGVPEYMWRAISSMKVKQIFDPRTHKEIGRHTEYRLWSKTEAQRMLATYLGMLVERVGDPNGKPLLPLAAVREILQGVAQRKNVAVPSPNEEDDDDDDRD